MILPLLEELACTVHHKIRLNELLLGHGIELRQALTNNDSSFIKVETNESSILADRTTIFDL